MSEPSASSPQSTVQLPSSSWWQALSLHERLTAPVQTSNEETADAPLARWRKEIPSVDDVGFAKQLAAEGLDVTTLRQVLGEPAEALAARLPDALAWFADVAAAYGQLGAEDGDGPAIETSGFATFIAPVVQWAVTQLRARIASYTDQRNADQRNAEQGTLPFAPAVAEAALVEVLGQQLPRVAERMLVLEMHVARLQDELTGETPEARFAAYSKLLADPEKVWTLLAEYPVLARQLVVKARQTVNAIDEILLRLIADWALLNETFVADTSAASDRSEATLGKLITLELGAGDTHDDGRSVGILHFSSGTRVVYKPRSLAVDVHFQALLRWINVKSPALDFRTLAVLDQADYGWVEFVAPAPIASIAGVERFYQRQGGYLALLYALSAADFHFENLIASGEHPVLIDLEALFHPDGETPEMSHPEQLARVAMEQSVLSIGMLPQRMRFHADAAPIDVSGIGGAERQMSPDKLPVWEGVGTDEMHLTRRHVEFSGQGHRPQLASTLVSETGNESSSESGNKLDNGEIDPSAYAEAVAAGFDLIYTILLEHRDELTGPDGPLVAFNEVEVRVVARATRIYSLLLQESNHPDLLRDALDRDRLYTRLGQEVMVNPGLARLVASERADLHRGDVPIFHTKPSSTHLWDSRGQVIEDYLPASGMSRVRRQLARMGENDRTRQLWAIRAAFATMSQDDGHRTQAPAVLAERPGSEPTDSLAIDPDALEERDTWLDAARTIGDRLSWQAHRTGGHAVWIGLGMAQPGEWSLSPLTLHLYDGHAGLAYFLGYLGAMTGESSYTTLAEEALATTLAQAEPMQQNFPYIGAFNGWGGLIYTLAHLGQLWSRPDLWQKGLELADVAARYVDLDEQFDIIGGSAGCIGAAAALYTCTEDARLVQLMARCADHLVAHAQPQAEGVGWVVPNMGGVPLGGFSHGTSGIAWALQLAAQYIDEDMNKARYVEVAQAALAYEQTLYDPASLNWRDLRSDEVEGEGDRAHDHDAEITHHDEHDAEMMAWCHGAPGIGLARLAMQAGPYGDAQAREDAAIALAATLAKGFGHGHSLCHGDLGNLELLVQAAQVWDDPDRLAMARELAGDLLANQAQTGWVCGVPGGIETPGLMVGLAGIGYELLRLADPDEVPSLLLLEPPYLLKG